MIVTLTNPLTGKTRKLRGRLVTDHPASSYGQPVMLLSDGPLDVSNAVLQNARIIEPPKQRRQIELLAQWQASAKAMLGLV